MMKYEDVVTIEKGLKAMLEDEEKGIAEYERLAREAGSLGAANTALAYQRILEQEKKHAQKLRELIASAELAKFGMKPGQDVGVVMESAVKGEDLKVGDRVTVKTLSSGTLLGKIIGFDRAPDVRKTKRAIILLDDGREIRSVLEFVKPASEGQYAGTVMEPHRRVMITNPHISIEGDEMFALSEPRRGGYVGERAYARPPLKELSKVPETKVLPPPKIRGREPYAVRIPLKEMVEVPETKVLPPPRLRVGEGYRGYAGAVREPHRARY